MFLFPEDATPHITLAIRQKANLQTVVTRKQRMPNFPKN